MATPIRKIPNRKQRYPWHLWTDGAARRARKGRDFKCTAAGFASTVYSHAERIKVGVSVSIVSAKVVEFQFDKPVPK